MYGVRSGLWAIATKDLSERKGVNRTRGEGKSLIAQGITGIEGIESLVEGRSGRGWPENNHG